MSTFADPSGKAAEGRRNRFNPRAPDDDATSESESEDDHSFSDLSDGEDALEIHEGRADSRRKRQLVPSLSKLTTQELVREQRKQTLLSHRELQKERRKGKNAPASAGSNATGKGKAGGKESDFEVVPVAMTDPAVRARTLAIAQKMLDPKARRDILDASINRFLFNDDDDLPDWFVKDEQRNCKVQLPVTAEEIEVQRRRFQELNARPSRKVMEAVGRKRRKAQRMLHKLVEKGKDDPRAREKVSGLSVRKLMRSQAVKGAPKKASKYMDSMSYGQLRREKQRQKRQKGKKGR
ncbi:unnamed protein product [Phytomonas sp. Hart1]|nr:unnamed protein product [Phytomonas sp. Hart1]|eukprot:CCW70488.1 unnamed protein product [Phytomonas sp. isolate Hart1]